MCFGADAGGDKRQNLIKVGGERVPPFRRCPSKIAGLVENIVALRLHGSVGYTIGNHFAIKQKKLNSSYLTCNNNYKNYLWAFSLTYHIIITFWK